MGYILPEIYQKICNDKNIECPKVFVETGTFKGGVPHRILEKGNSILDPFFKKYYTIELSPEICRVASYRYKMFELYGADVTRDLIHSDDPDYSWQGVGQFFDGRLTLFEGDSANVLSELMPTINEPVCFWLDAHSGAQKYGRGTDDVALFRELEVIRDHNIDTHFIAIDDVHLFGQLQRDNVGNIICDYTQITIEIVTQKIKEINPAYEVSIIAPFNMLMMTAVIPDRK